MILSDPDRPAPLAASHTLDGLFRLNAVRRPDAPALADPLNRMALTGGEPRRLTYAQADRAVDAIAGRLRDIGLSADTVVGIQLPNVVESVLTLLAVIRAGLIAVPLPLLWRRADCVAALSRVGARAIVTCSRAGGFDHGALAMSVAAELFPIRVVCGYGEALPDGIVAFDDLLEPAEGSDYPLSSADRGEQADAHIAAITFDITAKGLVPVPRSHRQWLAAGLPVIGASRLGAHPAILSTVSATSFAGLAGAMVPWLLTGGALALHHPFEPELLGREIAESGCTVLVAPEAVVPRLCESGLLDPGPMTVISVCRSPERAPAALPKCQGIGIVDVAVFGEAGLLAAARGEGWPAGPVAAVHGEEIVEVAHVAPTPAGTVGLRGAMVATDALPHATEAEADYFRLSESGQIDTGYPCRLDANGGLVVTAAPAGLVSVGGYRFPIRDLQRVVGDIDRSGILAALPDALSGHRLAGHAASTAAVQAALRAAGFNPLVSEAFRERAAQPGAFAVPR